MLIRQWDSDKPAVTSGDVVIVKECVEVANFAAFRRSMVLAIANISMDSACNGIWNDVSQEYLVPRLVCVDGLTMGGSGVLLFQPQDSGADFALGEVG
jgi:hypothetical protein